MFIAAQFSAAKRCTSHDPMISTMQNVCNGEYYTFMKKNEVPIDATTSQKEVITKCWCYLLMWS